MELFLHFVHQDIHADITGRLPCRSAQRVVYAHQPAVFLIADNRVNSLSPCHIIGILGKGPFIVRLMKPQRNGALPLVGIEDIPHFLQLRFYDVQIFHTAVFADLAEGAICPLIFLVRLPGLQIALDFVRVQLGCRYGADIHGEPLIVLHHFVSVVEIAHRNQSRTQGKRKDGNQHRHLPAERHSEFLFFHFTSSYRRMTRVLKPE